MEAKFADKLKTFSLLRFQLIEKVHIQLPQKFVDSTATFHTIVIISTFLLIASIFSTTKSLTLFSLHPICMCIGVLIFLAEGIVSYKNDSLLDAFSPIMQHTKKAKSRAIHQSMQVTGTFFVLFGLLLIIANKIEYGHSIIPSSVHSVMGTIAVLLLCVQAVIGQQKYDAIELGGGHEGKIRRWHSDAGLLMWDWLCLTLLTGLISFVHATFTNLLVELSVVAAWLVVHCQMTHSPYRQQQQQRFNNATAGGGVDGEGYGLNTSGAMEDGGIGGGGGGNGDGNVEMLQLLGEEGDRFD